MTTIGEILVVDDDRRMHELIAEVLTRESYGVQALSRAHVLHTLQEVPVDLVLSDIRMPEMDEMLVVVQRAIEERRLRAEVLALRQEVQTKYQFANILCKSKPMQELFTFIRKVAGSRSTVLVQGRSGPPRWRLSLARGARAADDQGDHPHRRCGL
jgi:DNA-binding NtrC family response regulator